MKQYTDADLGQDILLMINQKYSLKEMAEWAHEIRMKLDDRFSEKGDDALMTLMAMDEGPEFELTTQELKELANLLININVHPN